MPVTSTFTPDVVQYLDGVETLLTSLQTLTTTLGTYVDGLEAGQASSTAAIVQVRDYLDTVETKLQALITGPLSVETSAPLLTSATYFATADARNGLMQTYVEERENGDERTVTITRSTSTGAITGQSASAWA